MELKQRSFKITTPKYYVDQQLKFRIKAFERESDYIDFILFFGIATYLCLLYLVLGRESKVKDN